MKTLHSRRSCTERKTLAHGACLIYEFFKLSDTDESVLDLNEVLKVGLKNDNVQWFNTRWDDTIIASKK